MLFLLKSQKLRLEMIRDALEAKAPRTYRQLKMQGKLDEFVRDHEAAMMEAYNPCEAIIGAQRAGKEQTDGLKMIQDIYLALKRHKQEVLETWLEFSD